MEIVIGKQYKRVSSDLKGEVITILSKKEPNRFEYKVLKDGDTNGVKWKGKCFYGTTNWISRHYVLDRKVTTIGGKVL